MLKLPLQIFLPLWDRRKLLLPTQEVWPTEIWQRNLFLVHVMGKAKTGWLSLFRHHWEDVGCRGFQCRHTRKDARLTGKKPSASDSKVVNNVPQIIPKLCLELIDKRNHKCTNSRILFALLVKLFHLVSISTSFSLSLQLYPSPDLQSRALATLTRSQEPAGPCLQRGMTVQSLSYLHIHLNQQVPHCPGLCFKEVNWLG